MSKVEDPSSWMTVRRHISPDEVRGAYKDWAANYDSHIHPNSE